MIFRNTLVNLAGLGGALVLGFATTALLAGALGPAPFGLLMLVRSIVGNVGILESLFGTGITRYVAFYHGQADLERRDTFLGTGLLVNLLQGTVISIAAIAISYVAFDRVFSGLPAGLLQQGPPLLAIFFIVFIVQLCSLALSRALEGLQAYPAIRTSETVVQALTLGLLVVTLRNKATGALVSGSAGNLKNIASGASRPRTRGRADDRSCSPPRFALGACTMLRPARSAGPTAVR